MDFKERFLKLLGDDRGAISRLSKAVGASTGLVSAWKSGDKKPGFEYIPKVAEHFSVTTDYLLCVSNESKESVSGLSGQEVALLGLFRDLPDDAHRDMVFKQVSAAVDTLSVSCSNVVPERGEEKEKSPASLRGRAI